jgi:cytochrome c oxidase subunit 3
MTSSTLDGLALHSDSGRAAETGLWVLIGVVSTLFALFIVAYAMRMDSPDWSAIALPGQLWLSTALLLGASLLMQNSAQAATGMNWRRSQDFLIGGGALAIAFLLSQLSAWNSLVSVHVVLAGNPAASFFYVLTALHGLHLIGGLVAWGLTVQGFVRQSMRRERLQVRITLCARYWHFLLAVWVILFATLSGLTPEIVRFICGRG